MFKIILPEWREDQLFVTHTPQNRMLFSHQLSITLALSEESQIILASDEDKKVYVRTARKGEESQSFRIHLNGTQWYLSLPSTITPPSRITRYKIANAPEGFYEIKDMIGR